MSLLDRRIDFVYFYFALFVGAAFLIIDWRNHTARFCLLACLFFVIGALRYNLALPLAGTLLQYDGQERTLEGYVAREPDIRTDGVRYIIQTAEGKVYLKSDLYPRYAYGDVLEMRCQLKSPRPILDSNTGRTFHFDKYLATFGVFITCQYPQTRVVGESEGNGVYRAILAIKQKVAERIALLWHEPSASFMAGLLYGYRGGLGQLSEDFNRAGVSHIVAVSGYNIGIIVVAIAGILPYVRIRRQHAFWVITAGLVMYALFTGASASVVRAALLGWLVLLGPQVGRLSRPAYLLVPTAALMVLHNPFILAWDIGFQLSFLATLGILYLAPRIEEKLAAIPERLSLRQTLSATLAAIIATLPLILYQFGRLSIVAPVANLLILWTIPWLMLVGALTVGFSFLSRTLSAPLAWLTWLGMEYVVRVVRFFAALSWAAVNFSLTWYMMVGVYAALVAACLWIRKSTLPPSSSALF